MTDPSTWPIYGGLTEPNETVEWNPDCPEHGVTDQWTAHGFEMADDHDRRWE